MAFCAGALAQEADAPGAAPAGAEAEYHPVLDPANRATLSVGYEETWVREDGSPAEEEQWATLSDDALSSLSAVPDEAARRELLASGDAAALAAALEGAEARIDELGNSLPTIQRDIRRLRVQALRDSPKAKETHAEIKRLEDELEAWADALPEVAARREAAEAVNRNLLGELQFRRELRNKLEQMKQILEP
jgi:septal ring factor EnvC (AmiA/AmiB activator)